MIPVRYKSGEPRVTRTFDENGIPFDHPLSGTSCPVCDLPLLPGQRVSLVYVGPGSDPDDQAKAADGRWHTGASVAVHEKCGA